MAINLSKKASDKVCERFRQDSVTEGLFSDTYDWTGVATVQVYTVDNLPLQTYDKLRTSGSRFGTMTEVGDTMQELTVSDDKAFNGSIDRGHNDSQAMIKSASSVLRRTTDEVLIPYVDKYRLGKLADGAGIKDYEVELTAENVVQKIFEAGVKMSNAMVPKRDRVLFMGETEAMKLKLAASLAGLETVGAQALVNGAVGVIDSTQVRVVPDDYMPEDVAFMIVKTGCACAPKKIETYRIIEDDKDVDGAVVQGRFLHDCFVLKTRKNGIYVAYTCEE